MAHSATWRKSRSHRIASYAVTFFGLLWGSALFAPKLLAFPYHAQIGETSVYSEAPIAPNMKDILARSGALLRQSKIYSDQYGKSLYLTSGGWRWRVLAVRSSGAYALSRAFGNTIVINRTDIAADRVSSDFAEGRTRTLTDTIAHERTHGLLRAHFGLLVDFTAPTWKREGYCDHVAQASSLSDAQFAELERRDPDHPALPYYSGRKRVAAILAGNGGSVDQLFKD